MTTPPGAREEGLLVVEPNTSLLIRTALARAWSDGYYAATVDHAEGADETANPYEGDR